MSAVVPLRPAGLPADVNRLATRKEMRTAVLLLSTMQHRKDVDPAVMAAAFEIALEGTCAIDLDAAVRGILQSGETFMPGPSELRGQCNRLAWMRPGSPQIIEAEARDNARAETAGAKQIEDRRPRVEDAAKPIALLYHPEYQRKREERLARYSGKAVP